MEINYNHYPSDCPRPKSFINLLLADVSIDDEKRRKQFEERYELVNRLFPLPPSDDQNNSQSSSNSNPPSPNDSPQDFSIHNLDC